MGSVDQDEAKAIPRVGDALTRYVWRTPAQHLQRLVRSANIPPMAIRVAEALLSLLVFALFWKGYYWIGLLVAVPAMIGATEPLAAIYPMLWWWGWAHGLETWGRPLEPVYAVMVLWVVIGGAVTIGVIEIIAWQRSRILIHAWEWFDTRFKLVSASRNPNLVILALSLLAGRPDSGLVLVAWWTLISLIVHSVRLAQMTERQARGQKITSWIDR